MNNNLAKTKEGLNFLDELTPRRMLTLLIIIIVVCIAVYFGWSKLKLLFLSIKTSAKVEEEIVRTGENPTYTDAQYKQMADSIEVAVRGLGTDEQTIYNVFYKMEKNVDVLMLKKAYGIRFTNEDLRTSILNDGKSLLKAVNVILVNKGLNEL
jgi:hypothetical protein